MPGIIVNHHAPTARRCITSTSPLVVDGDFDAHSYCTYDQFSILTTVRHSLDIHGLFHEEASDDKHSLSVTACRPSTPPSPTASSRFSTSSFGSQSSSHCRSLTDPVIAADDEMNALVAEAPGSPPGLTGSKSSKSSSWHSSSFTGAEGILSDITNFEDIGLGEETQALNHTLHTLNGMEKPKRPGPRATATSTSTSTNGPRHSVAAISTMRELTNAGNRFPYPTLQGPVNPGPMKNHPPIHSLSLPNGGGVRRGMRSPSSPSLAMTAMSNRSRSRSPSPNPKGQAPSSLKPMPDLAAPRRPGLVPVPMNNIHARRGSWQPSRKSIQELEAEYNDSDEDLPDDASLWNVPLSPRPPSERGPISAAVSPRTSPGVSPERPSLLRNSIGAAPLRSPRTVPIGTANRALSPNLGPTPHSPRRPPIRGASTGMMPDHLGLAITGSKSWNIALSELSDEAKSLTEALENHAGLAEQEHEEAVQSGEAIKRSSLEPLARSKASTIELPPLRTNNVMVDPLPISKEKEKVLSRTRPSWLPPKSQKEERKHLKEYQRMMEMSLEADKRRAAKLADSQCAKDDTKSALLRIWEEHVLPNWDQVIREPRTRELWWRGVAPKSRAQVWQKAIGNELALTENTYTKALRRARDVDARLAQKGSEDLNKEKAWFGAIRRDVKITFPELNIFQPGGPLHDDLVDVLMAYSMYRSDVGYSHGTHLIAALFSLTLPNPASTFLTLCNLLNRPVPLAFLTGDPTATAKAYSLVDALLSHKNPRLYAHLFNSPTDGGLGLTAHEVLEPMIRTLFLGPGHGLGVETAARVWDVMVFDGDGVIVRTAVAIFGALEGRLYGDKEEVLDVLGWRGGGGGGGSEKKSKWDVGGEEDFMFRVRSAGKEEKGKVG